MSLLSAIIAGFATTVEGASKVNELQSFLADKVKVEDLLSDLVSEGFITHLPRLEHLCPDGRPEFLRKEFKQALCRTEIKLSSPDELPIKLVPILSASVATPGATCHPSEFEPIYRSILKSAVRGLWAKLGKAPSLARQTLLENVSGVDAKLSHVQASQRRIEQQLANLLESFGEFANRACSNYYDQLTDTSPPKEHSIDNVVYINPFLLARAEDFNHNYSKLAKLFQMSDSWESLKRRTDNVFLEGGRGTGKSMLLRRLTAQTVIANARLSNPHATFDDLDDDYFGVYIKLTRGYYEQFVALDNIPKHVAELLAQHELNIEIADAFVEALKWLFKERCLPSVEDRKGLLLADLNAMFPRAEEAATLDEFQSKVLRAEQSKIHEFYRNQAFGVECPYRGSADQTVTFLRELSKVFRNRLFPSRQVRLFLLIDEFETLLPIQQIAINTVIKMRLPDLSLKIGVRKAGRRTSDTFTAGDPIQDPRDYTALIIDYKVENEGYSALLKGIAEKRLAEAGYNCTDICCFLPGRDHAENLLDQDIEAEMQDMWRSGNRRSPNPTDSFRGHARVAAIYRLLNRRGSKKEYCGFDHYSLLSSGVISNFIELCKYAFFFALSDELPLQRVPAIPYFLQSRAAYAVSERLFDTIDGNVPEIGGHLKSLLADLGAILRSRLLKHSSEPEANRFEIVDYDRRHKAENKLVYRIIESAVVWSVIHIEGVNDAFRPRNSSKPAQPQVIINRIYAPFLGFSPRSRWRVDIALSDLRELIDPSKERYAFRRLMRTLGAEKKNDIEDNTLFDKKP